MNRSSKTGTTLLGILSLLRGSAGNWLHRNVSLKPFENEEAPRAFASAGTPGFNEYASLFQYFTEAFLHYRGAHRGRATYPGLPSWHGNDADGLEGFARFCPLLGAWLSGGNDPDLRTHTGEIIRLADLFFDGLIAGTDPASPEYWGKIRHVDQKIVEASDIALTLWMLRREFRDTCTPAQQQAVLSWLQQSQDRVVHDNNWHLFPIVIGKVLQAFGEPVDMTAIEKHYSAVMRFSLGDGWFQDGAKGAVDYYNAWGMHYAMSWIRMIDPQWHHDELKSLQQSFLRTYPSLIGPQGYPVMGRSMSYRLAVPSPVIFGYLLNDGTDVGLAKRSLDAVWTYFLSRGAVKHGVPTQGLFEHDARMLESYSGPASPLWGLRSLVVAFLLPKHDAFWTARGTLPVEKASYSIDIPAAGWTVSGTNATKEIVIRLRAGTKNEPPRQYGIVYRILFAILRLPLRRTYNERKYGLAEYSSAVPQWRA